MSIKREKGRDVAWQEQEHEIDIVLKFVIGSKLELETGTSWKWWTTNTAETHKNKWISINSKWWHGMAWHATQKTKSYQKICVPITIYQMKMDITSIQEIKCFHCFIVSLQLHAIPERDYYFFWFFVTK